LACQAHLGEVRSFKTEFDRRGVAVAVVSFAEPANLIPYQQRHQWPFAVFADPTRKAYQAFELKRLSWLHVFSPSTVKLYFKLLRAGMRRENYGKDDIYQSGGDFMLDRSGNLIFAHCSQDPADRPPVAEMLQAIDRR
jgi:peroxiredoxin